MQSTRWVSSRRLKSKQRKISEDYYKGLNFLLNEEPDKAIEVFIKAIEVDTETVELHLALGGLFRRKGQVDRATRVHQNLIARPHLSDEHRLQAIYELAQDYDHAGLLDRAENLYKELMDSPTYRKQSIEGLEKIYRREKEWRSAIDVISLHRRQDKPELNESLAQCWCELAEEAIGARQYANADKYLRNASFVNKESPRTLLLKGDLAFALEDYASAARLWCDLATRHASLVDLVLEKVIRAYRLLNNLQGLTEFLQTLTTLPRGEASFAAWHEACVEIFGKSKAQEMIVLLMRSEGMTGAAAKLMLADSTQGNLGSSIQEKTLIALLEKATQNNLQYTCSVCGYSVKSIHWHCPNCSHWETFH
jgi:lipopolysaccharide biosynthesis regulator YciM